MPDLAPMFPLMQPVLYNGHQYFTSQFFHRQYIGNSQAAHVKFKWHQDFVRLLKSLEAYPLYVTQGNIQEIAWVPRRKEGGCDPAYLQQIKMLEDLFRAVGFQKIYLLDATAQAAMSHHLDDEISKQMSVAINTTVARQASTQVIPSPHPVPALPPPMSFQEHVAFLQSCTNGLIALGVFDDRDSIEMGARLRQLADASMRQVSGIAPAALTPTMPALWTVSMRMQDLGYPPLRGAEGDSLQIKVGMAVKKAYTDQYGESPKKTWDHVKGAKRQVNAYPLDRLDVVDATLLDVLGVPRPLALVPRPTPGTAGGGI